MAITSDTILFSLSHFYHTLSQDIHFFFEGNKGNRL